MPVYHFGEVVGQRRIYNDSLLMFLLRNRAPKRFAADSWQKTDAVTQGKLKRLRAQWQKEWEEEQAAQNSQSAAESKIVMDTLVDRTRATWLERMSPKTRAAFDALMAAQLEDDEARWATEPGLPAGSKARLIRSSSRPNQHILPSVCTPTSERTGKPILPAPWDKDRDEGEEEEQE